MRVASLLSGTLALLVLASCASRSSAPPTPGYERGVVPELRGQRVILLPLQMRSGGHSDLGRELEYAVGQAGGQVDWVMPEATRAILERSPGTGILIDQLPVRAFLAGELQRVGDPLFGDLYRLGALVGAPLAFLPIESRARVEDATETIEISAALLDVRTGRVVWFGVVEGAPGPPGALATSASAADVLAARLSR